MSIGAYPQRDSFFAHRFVRLLTKSAAAQELGPEAAWLLTVIAHQEDAKRYTGPVTYWGDQIMTVAGCRSKGRFIRTRKKAIDAGWLHYQPGGKSQPAKYWCLIPKAFENLPDSPCDESIEFQNGTANARDEFQNGTDELSLSSKTELEMEPIRNSKRNTFYPTPNPSPTTSLAGANDGADIFQEFIKTWNKSGLTNCRKLTDKRRKALRARLQDPDWKDSWREALSRAAKSPFCRGQGERGWKADVDWFLKPDSVTKILEGKYDDQTPRTGQRVATNADDVMERHTAEVLARKRAEQAEREAARKGSAK